MNKKKKWILGIVFIIIATNIATMFGTYSFWQIREGNAISKFEKIFEVRNTLYKYYDGKIDDSVLLEGALKGMTSSLKDPYTVFMNKKEFNDFNTETEGNYSGIGIQVASKDNKIQIQQVFEDSPSKKAGLMTNDIIEKVNGIEVNGNELEKAVSIMKGKEGTEVKLTIFRKNKGSFDVKVKRAKVNMVTVTGEIVDNNVGYIQVSMFDENTAKNFKKELTLLKSKGMKSLIIDLRDNPGGVLDQCVSMVSNFLPSGKVVVSTIDKYNNKKEYKSEGGNFYNMPITVLTNGNSASASEIFSGAIRDYKLGTLVGEKTFGKGVVQTMFDTGEGTALKVTISKYYTPSGENIHKKGIKPNVQVVYPDSLKNKPYDRNSDPQFIKALQIAESKIK
ncbi:PDZ domain-containing protein [Clostridium tyrobutyricum]|uniref:Carboxyl-terminal protease n=1 Tax=Clostridium tyrobutyricum DIVETGP TaxID=1408889 RepID=W6N4J6_CLOTY|nr:S41 family peptidase [Clostridium tyrobutyricum]AND86024.1 carboxyl-terminal protease [Clostridium tyrobutyricum]ANP70524.1 peptidase S41 [Clostridium tyrobutyricum]MBV4434943.1 S41 family peptidase [Clostridium tyrobutyricum]QNB67844.1 PDZ domain-containing protein [Clostridium tyrobutyricum]CDL90910.1 Carboxyl-terminal protease [Clostridium tyrobutyricum DIVETGP]